MSDGAPLWLSGQNVNMWLNENSLLQKCMTFKGLQKMCFTAFFFQSENIHILSGFKIFSSKLESKALFDLSYFLYIKHCTHKK